MKKSFIIMLILFFSVSVCLFAQEPQKEEPKKKWEPPTVNIGNVVIIYGGVNYGIAASPFGSVGFGFDFQIGENMVFSPSIKMINRQVSAGTSYSGATSVTGGEINYLDIGLSLKYFVQESWWISAGFIYEAFLNGYYIDDAAAGTLFSALDSTDELNNLGLNISTGLYAPIGNGIYMIPSGSFRFNLPNSSSYTFAISNFIFSIDFGIGIKI